MQPTRRGLHRHRAPTALAVAMITLAACSGTPTRSDSDAATGTTATTRALPSDNAPRIEITDTIATGLAVPWGVAFLPNGDALVSERDSAKIRRVSPDGDVTDIGTLPGVVPGGEGGQLDLTVSPDFESNHLLYVYYTAADDNRIARLTYRNGDLGEPEQVLNGIPKGTIHNGGRVVFGPDGMLYASTGNTGRGALSQDKASLAGKILRMTPEGDIPEEGNPFDDSLVYSYGHRNVEGMAFDSDDRLWASEFGESTWDELNLIEQGGNYGWPEVEGTSDDEEFIDPVWQWSPDEASPSGIAIVDDIVYMASLRGERVWQIPIAGERVRQPRDFFTDDYGRLRSIAPAPDGTLWLTTSNRDGRGNPGPADDRILRVVVRD